jgi:hypothetical protein
MLRGSKQYKADLERATKLIDDLYPKRSLSDLSGIAMVLLQNDLGHIKVNDLLDYIEKPENGRRRAHRL